MKRVMEPNTPEDLAQVLQQVQPLYAWIRASCSSLKSRNRWPLRQEDVPPELLHLYQLYRANKAQLQVSQKKQQVRSKQELGTGGGHQAGSGTLRAPLQPAQPQQHSSNAQADQSTKDTTERLDGFTSPLKPLRAKKTSVGRAESALPGAACVSNNALLGGADAWATLRCSTKVVAAKQQQQRHQEHPSSPLTGTPKGSAVLLASLRSPGSCSRLGPTPPGSARPQSVSCQVPCSPIGHGFTGLLQHDRQHPKGWQSRTPAGLGSSQVVCQSLGFKGRLPFEQDLEGTPASKRKPAADGEQLDCVPATGKRPKGGCRSGGCEEEGANGQLSSPDLSAEGQNLAEHPFRAACATLNRLASPSTGPLRRRALFQHHFHSAPRSLDSEGLGGAVSGPTAETADAKQQQGKRQLRDSAVLHHLALQDCSLTVKPARPPREEGIVYKADYVDYFKLHQQAGNAASYGAAPSDLEDRQRKGVHPSRPSSLQLARARSHPHARKSLRTQPSMQTAFQGHAATASCSGAAPATTATSSCSNILNNRNEATLSCCAALNGNNKDTLSTMETNHTPDAEAAGRPSFMPLPCSVLLDTQGAHQPLIQAQHTQRHLAPLCMPPHSAAASMEAATHQLPNGLARTTATGSREHFSGSLTKPSVHPSQGNAHEPDSASNHTHAEQNGADSPTKHEHKVPVAVQVQQVIAQQALGGNAHHLMNALQQHGVHPLEDALQMSVRVSKPQQAGPSVDALPVAATASTPTQHQNRINAFQLEASTPTQHKTQPQPLLSPQQPTKFSPGLVRPGLNACRKKGLSFQAVAAEHLRCASLPSPNLPRHPLANRAAADDAALSLHPQATLLASHSVLGAAGCQAQCLGHEQFTSHDRGAQAQGAHHQGRVLPGGAGVVAAVQLVEPEPVLYDISDVLMGMSPSRPAAPSKQPTMQLQQRERHEDQARGTGQQHDSRMQDMQQLLPNSKNAAQGLDGPDLRSIDLPSPPLVSEVSRDAQTANELPRAAGAESLRETGCRKGAQLLQHGGQRSVAEEQQEAGEQQPVALGAKRGRPKDGSVSGSARQDAGAEARAKRRRAGPSSSNRNGVQQQGNSSMKMQQVPDADSYTIGILPDDGDSRAVSAAAAVEGSGCRYGGQAGAGDAQAGRGGSAGSSSMLLRARRGSAPTTRMQNAAHVGRAKDGVTRDEGEGEPESEGSEFEAELEGRGAGREDNAEEAECDGELSEDWQEDSPARPAKRRAAPKRAAAKQRAGRAQGNKAAKKDAQSVPMNDSTTQAGAPLGQQTQQTQQQTRRAGTARTLKPPRAPRARSTAGVPGARGAKSATPAQTSSVANTVEPSGAALGTPAAASTQNLALGSGAGETGEQIGSLKGSGALGAGAGGGGGGGGAGARAGGSGSLVGSGTFRGAAIRASKRAGPAQHCKAGGESGYSGVRASAPLSLGSEGGVAKKHGVAAGKGTKGGGNFVRYNMKGGKGSFGYESRSAASGRLKASRTRLRRLHGGKVIRTKWTAPSMAGQGADFLEGFKSDKRCFRCGGQGHWAAHCPFDKGTAPENLQAAADDVADAEAEDAAKGAIPGASPNTKARRQAEGTTALTAGMCRSSHATAASGVQATASLQTKDQKQQIPAREPFQLSALLLPELASEIAGVYGLVPAGAPAQPVDATAASHADAGAGAHDATQAAHTNSEAAAPSVTAAQSELGQPTLAAAGAGLAAPKKEMGTTGAQGFSSMPAPHQLSDEQLRRVLHSVFGHEHFRGRQLEVVRAVLEEHSLLAVLPTGAGKSLCYQLPAVLLPGVTLVVSPLLALMRDQLDRLPAAVPGAMLWGGQTRLEAEQVLEDVARGAVKLLYVAPEKLLNPSVLTALRKLQQIPLVCIDEAHCVSEWGHSFRPAYFRLGHILRKVLRPKAILGLTATATRNTQAAISQVLGLPPSTIRELPLRDNIRLQVLHMDNGTQSGRSRSWLLQALRSGSLSDTESIVVYVAFQAQADEVADRLKQAGICAASYHAGKHMDERLRVQASFCSGSTRVVVATVAFGMGVDKAEVGAVVHLTLPHSLEDYVQQVGRAGRDGKPARAVLVLDKGDYLKLRSLSHKGAVEQAAVRQLCEHVFAPLEQQAAQASADGAPVPMRGAFGVLPTVEAVMELDMAEESMETVMSYLQGHDGHGALAVLPPTCAYVDVFFHRTPPARLAMHSPVVAALLAAKPRVTKGAHRVPMSRLVAAAGMSSSAVMYHLSDLAKRQEIHFEGSKAKALSWRLALQPQPNIEELAKSLQARLMRQLKVSVRRLDVVWLLMATAASAGDQPLQERVLRSHIHAYFDSFDEFPSLDLVNMPPCTVAGLALADHAPMVPFAPSSAPDLDLAGALNTVPSTIPSEHEPTQVRGPAAAEPSGRGDGVVAGAGSSQAGGSTAKGSDADRQAAVQGDDDHKPAAGSAGNVLNDQEAGEIGGGSNGPTGTEDRALYGATTPQLPVVMFPERARVQVTAFLRAHKQRIMDMAKRGQPMGGIAVARIFHGLTTPAYPVQQWAKCGFWGQYTAWDFSAIVTTAQVELARAARQQSAEDD